MLPTHRRLPVPQTVEHNHQVLKTLKKRQDTTKEHYDQSSRDLHPLKAGDKVRMHSSGGDPEWRKAEVLPRSYLVTDDGERTYRRNRKHLIANPNDQPMFSQAESNSEVHPSQEELPKTKNTPTTTRSGRVVKRPRRLIAS